MGWSLYSNLPTTTERRQERNKIGTAFTVNDDALASKIDNIITSNPTPLYSSVLDTSATQGISTKFVADISKPIINLPTINVPSPAQSTLLDTSAAGILSQKPYTGFANQNIINPFASATDSVRDDIKETSLELGKQREEDEIVNRKSPSLITDNNSVRDIINSKSGSYGYDIFDKFELEFTADTEKEPTLSFEKEIFHEKTIPPRKRAWDEYRDKLKNIKVDFQNIQDASYVSSKSLDIIKKIASLSNNARIVITSSMRTPLKQAEIMFKNLSNNGVFSQRSLYGSAGDKVIDVYEENQDLPQPCITKLMANKIEQLGPTNISRHLNSYFTKLNVFDIGYSSFNSIIQREDFYNSLLKYKDELSIKNIIREDGNGCFHIEITQ